MGSCPACGAWNTLQEEIIRRTSSQASRSSSSTTLLPLSQISIEQSPRIQTGLAEFDRVMGGGIMPGSISLIAGDPGIGKSTLMTELGRYLSNHTLLYVTGEESPQQVRLRAQRMGVSTERFFLMAETDVNAIIEATHTLTPDILIVDSIQTITLAELSSAPGTVTQVRESAAALMQLTKGLPMATFLIGHVTKEGHIAGPRVLEHMVDTVLYFEGDRHHAYRILRTIKNRFGAAHELGLFEMHDTGLREVRDPGEIFLAERQYGVSGSTVTCTMEGTRPLLVEIQALVTTSSYGVPQRTTSGFDTRRLQMLLAILEKRVGLRTGNKDVFLNIAGGVRIDEPAADLGVIVSIASSLKDIPADSTSILIGEVGLGGEIRTVSRIEPRLHEAARLGFKRAVIPASNLRGLAPPDGLEIVGISQIHEAIQTVL